MKKKQTAAAWWNGVLSRHRKKGERDFYLSKKEREEMRKRLESGEITY